LNIYGKIDLVKRMALFLKFLIKYFIFISRYIIINIMSQKNIKRKKSKVNGDLARHAYLGIRQMLFYNEIMPGQKIKYQDLADRLDVSITPIIHALKWLEFRDIVRHEPNKGYYINEISKKEVEEIYDTRIMLEVALLSVGIERIDDENLQPVDKAINAYEKAYQEGNYYGRMLTDMRFHMEVAALSDSRIKCKMLQELFDLLLLKYSRNLVATSIMDSSRQDHWQIYNEIKDRNLAAAQKTLANHLHNVKSHIIQNLDRMKVDKKEILSDYYAFR